MSFTTNERSNRMDGASGLFIIVVLFFIILLVIGVLNGERRRKRLDRNGVVVFATVTRIKRSWDDDDRKYSVTAQWTDPHTGSTYSFKKTRSRRPKCSEGSQIQVVLNPRNPRDYYIKDW